MTLKTTIERLDMTATMLEDLKVWRTEFKAPPGYRQFSPKTVVNEYGDKLPIPRSYDQRMFCGTAACAAGHAAFHPWFQARGLTIVDGEVTLLGKDKYGDKYGPFSALSKFYGIPDETARALFGASETAIIRTDDSVIVLGPHVTAKDVAKCIRKYVAEYLEEDLKVNWNWVGR